MINKLLVGVLPLLLLLAVLRAQQSVRGPAETWGKLRVEIVDHDSGKPVPSRCYLTDPTNQSWSPVGAINYVKPPERHFIADGHFEIALPGREYTLAVERGPEYRPATKTIEIRSGESREEKIELARWTSMNARGWYSADLHNHRDWREMPQLLLAEDLNVAPTLTQWVWEDRLTAKAPPLSKDLGAVRVVDSTHAYSVVDTEIERLRDGPGAVDLVGLKSAIGFEGNLLAPPNTVFTAMARAQGGYIDAEKITWRDVVALVALGQVDFAGIVNNHFNRHGVETETSPWGMIPKEKPEYETPAGLALWTMDVYYKFLNCGFRLPVSAGSASGVKASPLGYSRVYVHVSGKFGYAEFFRNLKAGRSFATNGPMLFLTVNGREPGDTISLPAEPGKATRKLKVHAEASSREDLDRLEIIFKGRVVKSVSAEVPAQSLSADLELEAKETGWLAARAFEKQGKTVRFAQTSPVYVRAGEDPGVVAEDAKYFVGWIDREIEFYTNLPEFRRAADREAMLGMFRRARAVYQRLAAGK